VEVGELAEGDQKVQTFSCKIISPGDVMYNIMTTANTGILLYLKIV